jgi:peroxiredoxin
MTHLLNKDFPENTFNSTSGFEAPAHIKSDWLVIYFFPMISDPVSALPEGWLSVPGAAGCTAESCGFRDFHSELKKLNVKIFGLSSQSIEHQAEAKKRLGLPFDLLSDESLILKRILGLNTFFADGSEYYERITLVIRNGMICKVFYPVLSPQTHVHDVLDWLEKEGKNQQQNEKEFYDKRN